MIRIPTNFEKILQHQVNHSNLCLQCYLTCNFSIGVVRNIFQTFWEHLFPPFLRNSCNVRINLIVSDACSSQRVNCLALRYHDFHRFSTAFMITLFQHFQRFLGQSWNGLQLSLLPALGSMYEKTSHCNATDGARDNIWGNDPLRSHMDEKQRSQKLANMLFMTTLTSKPIC